jgi:hypothetical protein
VSRDPFDEASGRPGDEARLSRLAEQLGVALPPFDGPLVAFDPAGERSGQDPVYLGGDLHAIHPDAAGTETRTAHDETLEDASISFTLADFGGEALEAIATRGIWCVALHDELAASSLYLMLRDSSDRLRAWLLLPPASSMIGRGHHWLPRVPSAV